MAAAKLNDVIAEVTERIGGRSAATRGEYLERTRKRKLVEPARGKLACANPISTAKIALTWLSAYKDLRPTGLKSAQRRSSPLRAT